MRRKFLKKQGYDNPFMRKPPMDGFFKRHKKKFFVFLTVLLCGGFVYLFIFSSVFKIKEIAVSGTDKTELINQLQMIVKNELDLKKWLILPKGNYFILNEKSLQSQMNGRLALDELEVSKKLFGVLEIYAKEKIAVLLLREANENYYIDKRGMVMGAVQMDMLTFDAPKIMYATSTQIIVGTTILEDGDVEFIKQVFEKSKIKFADWRFDYAVFAGIKNKKMDFYSNEKWYAIISVELGIDKQLDNLGALLEQKITDRNNLEYVDLRIEDRIFYK